eukprot:TRINITY_DN18328_c0_g1_i1.p1 TRINITY_DN18328_c0_g1~~TRINITY_DN18328_c0_g1_i1.p1  ORF type:complete len:353 (-),score=93.17 TRINITY_DN18328_c0_g1_i1:113-1171(-)
MVGCRLGAALLLVCAAVAVARAEMGYSHTAVYWHGGSPTCALCFGEGKRVEDFACSYNNRGDWNDGQQKFKDPTPADTLVTEVEVSMFGTFNCDPFSENGRVLVEINNVQISETSVSEATNCMCGNCVINVTVKASYQNGLPNYNHQEQNVLSVVTISNAMCLSYVNITLGYTVPKSLVLTSVFPALGPSNGSTEVVVFGDHFTDGTSCSFGKQEVKATRISETELTCWSPSTTHSETVDFYLTDGSGAKSDNTLTFVYYEEATVSSVSPTNTTVNNAGDLLLVNGHNFIDSEPLVCCKFFTSTTSKVSNAIYKADTMLACPSVAWAQAETVQLAVSLNAQQYSNAIPFNFA